MLIMSVRFGSRFSFKGQVAKCELQVVDKNTLTKRTFLGATFKEVFDKFRKEENTYLQN